jgi:drug/metabolite transporter (DMT)-like permease
MLMARYWELGAGMGGGGGSRRRSQGIGLAVVSSLCFSTSGVFGKALIGAGFGPMQAVWLRMAGSALVLVPLVLVVRGPAAVAAARPHWRPLVAYGLTGVAGCQALYFLAASRLPVGIAILLEYLGPVLVLGWIRFARRMPVRRGAAAGVVVALAGLACVVRIWSGVHLDAVGLAAGLGAAACQAAYFLIVERLVVDPLVLTAAGSVIGTVSLTVLAAPWAMPWGVLAGQVGLAGGDVPAWALLIWLVLISTVVAYLAGVASVQRLNAQVAAAICYSEAVAAIGVAWLVLGERLAAVQLAGGAIVLTGAYIAQRAAARPVAALVPQAAVPVPAGVG